MGRAVLAELWELLVRLEQLMHLLDVISKGCHHGEVLLGQLHCDSITLQQPLKALQQLECGGQCRAVIKGLQQYSTWGVSMPATISRCSTKWGASLWQCDLNPPTVAPPSAGHALLQKLEALPASETE